MGSVPHGKPLDAALAGTILPHMKALFDTVYAACCNPVKLLDCHPSADGRRKLGAEYKTWMRESRRYFVDDDATRSAAVLGVQHPEILLSMLRKARLPFARVWIEWNNRAQAEETGGQATESTPERIGVLLERLHEREPLYRMTVLGPLANGHAAICPVSVVYHLDQPVGALFADDRRAILEISELSEKYMDAALVGTAYSGGVIGTDSEEAEHRKALCEELTKHATLVITPFVVPIVHAVLAGRIHSSEQMRDMFYMQIAEQAGTWRMILSLLALINAQDCVATEHRDKTAGSRLVCGKPVPFLDHWTVTLKLSRKIAEARIVRAMADAIPRRRHEVTGHWKHSRKRWPGSPDCAHAWVSETGMREACAICGHKRWWVNEFMRGSAEIGVVTTDRFVTTD